MVVEAIRIKRKKKKRMKINVAYKTELKLNNKQKSQIDMFFGGARFAYNWGLKQRIELYDKEKKSTTAISQHKEFNKLKKTEFEWAYLYSKCVFQEALRDLEQSYKNFYRKVKNPKIKEKGFPKFKSKYDNKQSFRLTGAIHVKKGSIQLPRLGILKLKESNYIPIDEHILSVTVSKKIDKYFVSVAIEKEIEIPLSLSNQIIGVDLGIKSLAVASNGLLFENPKAYKKFLKKLKREQRWLSRKVKGSNNRRKQQKEVARIHCKIANIRKDNIHKMTTTLVNNHPKAIIIEDLSVSGMLKNHCLSQSITDSSFGEIRRQFEYKTNWNNIQLILADRFYASSKLCSICGYKNINLKLKDREWICNQCGTKHDRDKNAADNLVKYYSTVSSTGIDAFGEDKLQHNSNIMQWSSLREEINRTSECVKSL